VHSRRLSVSRMRESRVSIQRASPHNRYLFESRHSGLFTPRCVQQIVQKYRRRAGLDQHVHPHLFRHHMLSHLTAQGLSDSQIQLISGHESKRSLEVYQHLSLEQVERAYQAAVRNLDAEHELARRAAAA
jgi:site-specific recombinase XerD